MTRNITDLQQQYSFKTKTKLSCFLMFVRIYYSFLELWFAQNRTKVRKVEGNAPTPVQQGRKPPQAPSTVRTQTATPHNYTVALTNIQCIDSNRQEADVNHFQMNIHNLREARALSRDWTRDLLRQNKWQFHCRDKGPVSLTQVSRCCLICLLLSSRKSLFQTYWNLTLCLFLAPLLLF